jgi:succinate dehydrogenase / fumarate reductase membrane anchor subunit|tara:strand:- start:359 stop:688 length:330 start_codon:yes stop_codon:yes gene_type:complete
MNLSTKKWLILKYSSVVFIPLMIWFIINFISIYDADFEDLVTFFTSQPTSFLFSLFVVIAFFFSSLTISEIFEDYINDEKIKNVANKAIYLFAIIMPLITIISLFNLKL